MIVTLKRCSNPKCKNPWKPESEFYTDRTTQDGLRNQCINCVKEYNNKRKYLARDQYLELEFGFLPGEFEKISKSQDDKCLICNKIKKLVPDHCHKTYLNRGLLCISCNGNLGWYENNPIKGYLNKPEWKFCLVWLSPRNYKDTRLRCRHNICLDDWEMMFEIQNKVCGICKNIPDKTFHIDHDYQTLRVRGLLCFSCNGKLGWFENNSVQQYLEKYK